MNILTIDALSKSFQGRPVIDGLNLTVEEHSLFGFIGKNGAGKTTTMKMILGFLKPDGGRISVCGESVRYGSSSTNRFIGWLPDVPEFYPYMTPKEYLALCGRISGLSPAETQRRTRELLPLVGLDGVNRRIRGFSRGMKQRLGIAQALLNKPRLLICDEPTSALDPAGRREILDILKNVREETTLLFSTHILSDVERICDTIGILDQGRLVLEGRLSAIETSYRSDKIAVTLRSPEEALRLLEKARLLPHVSQAEAEGACVTVAASHLTETGAGLLALLAQEKLELVKYEVLEPDLEQIFLEATAK